VTSGAAGAASGPGGAVRRGTFYGLRRGTSDLAAVPLIRTGDKS